MDTSAVYGSLRGDDGRCELDDSAPFLAPWKKNFTTNTCRAAIVTMIKTSINENLRIRDSVERTVEKLRFSRVRKYFWLREMVESCPEILKRDSSSPDMCSAGAAPFVGISARSSFSTYVDNQSGPELRLSM